MDRRTRAWRLLGDGALDAPSPRRDANRVGMPEVEVIDGLEFDYRKEPRCFVCASNDDVRLLVDQQLVRGETYIGILRTIEPLQEEVPAKRRVTYSSVRRHQLRHLPVDELAIRRILERHAREQGLAIAIGDTPIITNVATLEIIRNAGFEALVQRAMAPSVKETIQAVTALEALESEHALDLDEIRRQVQVLIDAVRQRLTEEEWASAVADVQRQIEAQPTLPGSSEQEGPGR